MTLVLEFFLNKHGTTNHSFDGKIRPYGLIFYPQVEENECSILLLLLNLSSYSKSKENWFSNVCYSSQLTYSKITLSPNSSNQNDLFKITRWSIFFLLYLWAKYEPILSDFTAQTVTLCANLLIKAQIILQNTKCAIFFHRKLGLLKIFKYWIWLGFLRYGFFLQYWNMWKYLKQSKMCPKNINTINKSNNHKA